MIDEKDGDIFGWVEKNHKKSLHPNRVIWNKKFQSCARRKHRYSIPSNHALNEVNGEVNRLLDLPREL